MLKFAGELAAIINKNLPNRKEDAINQLTTLEGWLAEALKNNEDFAAAQIRVRMRQIREKFEDI